MQANKGEQNSFKRQLTSSFSKNKILNFVVKMVSFLLPAQWPGRACKFSKLVIVAMMLLVNSIHNTTAHSGVHGNTTAETATIIRDWSRLLGKMVATSFGFLSPPACARAFSILTTAEWNAFAPFTPDLTPVVVARYDEKPDPAQFRVKRLPRNEVEIRRAVSIAAFLALAEIFDPTIPCMGEASRDAAYPLLETEGLEMLQKHAFVSADSVTDAIDHLIANSHKKSVAARTTRRTIAYLNSRRNDGMNSRGDLSQDGLCYSDYTLYQAVNPPQTVVGHTNCSAISHIDKYQNLLVATPAGLKLRPWLAPYMSRVIPFTDETSLLWQMLDPPPGAADPEFAKQHGEVLEISGQLDDRDKIVAEFWADGPASNLPPGHWHDIAIEVSEMHNLGVDDTLHLLFLQANAAFDAGIAAWTAKRFYDSARPVTAIQCLYEGETVKAWRGPYQGVGDMSGSDWMPYQDQSFVTPPFAEFVSGHSTFSAASAYVLRMFLGTDEYGGTYTIKKGKSKFEPRIDDASDPKFVAGLTNMPNKGPGTMGYIPRRDVVLSWPTFTDAAKEAGYSRLLGGIHIAAGNDEGLKLGAMVGAAVWKRYRGLIKQVQKTSKTSKNMKRSKSKMRKMRNGSMRMLHEKNGR